MTLTPENELMSLLICKQLIGSINSEEQARLDAWRQANEYNEAAYQRLTDMARLQAEYVSDQQTDYRPALADMKQRIAALQSEPKNRPAWRRWAAVAVAAVVTAVGAQMLWRQYTRVVPPVISDEVKTAMVQSRQAGRQRAEIEAASHEELNRRYRQPTKPGTTQSSPSHKISQLLSALRITTHQDKEYWLTLTDGTLVHLNYNTHLIYPERFDGDERNVILDGEAYFMVATDKRRPFIVHTDQGDIRVHGTEFNVKTSTDGSSTEVVLVKGSLGIAANGGQEQLMKPGEQATFNPQSAAFEIETVDVSSYVAWNEGKFSFQSWPLDKVMAVLARWYGYDETVFRPDSLRQKRLDGSFSRYDEVGNIMESIATVLDLDITLKDKTITIQQQ